MTNFLHEDIKREMQGPNGLIRKVRSLHLPDTIQMAQLAQNTYEKTIGNYNDIDSALDKLLKIEYETYLNMQNEITARFIEYADDVATELNYPNIRGIIDNYIKDARKGSDPTKILQGVQTIIMSLADSNRQSRVSRSGSSLMHHISYLLEKNKFKIKVDFKREFILGVGCKLDFFFPSLEKYQEEPKNCCAVACMTTANDRFRLTFAQMPTDTRNRACTAIGSSNFGDKLGPKSLTTGKLEEAKANGVKFVILKSALDDRLRKSKAVMSYNDWFAELDSLRPFWK
jgi:hypothetical protein